MLSPVRTRGLALVGLLGMLPITWSVVQGATTLDVAAFRAFVLLAVLTLVDRLVLPLVVVMLQTSTPTRRNVDASESRRER